MAQKTTSAGKPPNRPHRIAVPVFDGVVLGDLAAPCELFAQAVDPQGRPLYEIRVCSETPLTTSHFLKLVVPHRLGTLAWADTVIVPGIAAGQPLPAAVIRALRRAIDRGTRVASICTGAFLLAATGALDGLRATTHWLAAAELSRQHPTIDVDPAVLYVDHGTLLTSAGAAAGHDLCLHLLRRDCGAAVAAEVARRAVMPLERAGGQAQYIVRPLPGAGGRSLAPLLDWMEAHLGEPLGIDDLARRASMSPRSLARHFKAQVGWTPAQWIAHARVKRAQQLLESTPLSIEQIAAEAGFASAAVLRERFRAVVGSSPAAYRRTYRAA